MYKDDCYYVGYFSKVIGTKGDVGLNLDVDEIENYLNLKSILVSINERDQVLVPFFIIQSSNSGKNTLRLSLKQIDNGQSAKNLVGKKVYLPISQLPDLKNDQFYYHEIIGFEVSDENRGVIGKVNDVIEYPAQSVLQIENDNQQEILIPIVDDTIITVNKKTRQLFIRSPEGLIDLYTSENV